MVDSADKVRLLNLDTRLVHTIKGEKTLSHINEQIHRFVSTGTVGTAFLDVIAKISPGTQADSHSPNADADIWAHYIQDKDSKYALVKDLPRSPVIHRQILAALAKKRISRLDMIQAVNTPSSMISRTQFLIGNRGGIKKVALLGDDDVLSILFRNYFQVSVFDLDSELIQSLKDEKIDAVLQNFLEPFDSAYGGCYDAVFCDPPTSPAWISLFLDRAISLSRPGGLISVACNPLGEQILYKETQARGLDLAYSEKTPTFYFDFRYNRMNYVSMQTYYTVTERTRPAVPLGKPHPAKILDKQANSSTLYYYDDTAKSVVTGEGSVEPGGGCRLLYPVFW
jgi:hypothetical protein